MSTIILLRHGKSDWKYDIDDYHRPLKRRGKDAALKVGQWFADHHFEPDLVLSSPAERTFATCKLCVKAMQQNPDEIITDSRLYLASVRDIIAVLSEHDWRNKCVLIVGHNPGLDDMVQYLSDTFVAEDEDGKLMSTAAFAIFDFPKDGDITKANQGKLIARKRPQNIP